MVIIKRFSFLIALLCVVSISHTSSMHGGQKIGSHVLAAIADVDPMILGLTVCAYTARALYTYAHTTPADETITITDLLEAQQYDAAIDYCSSRAILDSYATQILRHAIAHSPTAIAHAVLCTLCQKLPLRKATLLYINHVRPVLKIVENNPTVAL